MCRIFYQLPISLVVLALLVLIEPLQKYLFMGFVLGVLGLCLGLAKKNNFSF